MLCSDSLNAEASIEKRHFQTSARSTKRVAPAAPMTDRARARREMSNYFNETLNFIHISRGRNPRYNRRYLKAISARQRQAWVRRPE